jgi:hypothetical protein
VFATVAIFGGFMTEWEVLETLIANQGVGDEGVELIAFVGGYTFPLTLGLGVVFLGLLRNVHEGHDPPWVLLGAALVVAAAGAIASEVGLGLLPSTSVTPVSGPLWVSIPLTVFRG